MKQMSEPPTCMGIKIYLLSDLTAECMVPAQISTVSSETVLSLIVATPVVMSVIDGTNIVASQVQIGKATAVIFTTNGNVYTVGYNNYGQLGDGTTDNSSIPIRAKYVNDLKTIAY